MGSSIYPHEIFGKENLNNPAAMTKFKVEASEMGI